MAKSGEQPDRSEAEHESWRVAGVPLPTLRFKLRAWREFQRALDPLAPPKPFPRRQH